MRTFTLSAVIASAAVASSCAPSDPATAFHRLLGDEWAFRLAEDPLQATSAGVSEFDDRLPSMTLEDLARRAGAHRGFVARLAAIERGALSDQDRISYDMFRRYLDDAIAEYEFGAYRIPITVDNGFHIAFARLPNQVPLHTVQNYRNYIARLRAFPDYVDQHVTLMRQGLQDGFTMPRIVLDGYEVTIESHVVGDVTRSVFHVPFRRFPSTVPASDRDGLRASGEAAIREAVVPGYRTFLAFMTSEYIPNARETTGASALPEGRAYYEYLVRHFTTLDVTPEEVHEIGRREVERIRAEMEAIIEEVGFDGSFEEFLAFLRTDPRFYVTTPRALLEKASYIAKKMDGRLPALFGTLPRLPYGIQPVPDHLAPKYTGGRYIGAPLGGTQAGYYWVNTYALDSRPLYVLPALTLHEAVPGHHLQNALQQELEGLPAFRRFGNVNAFGEGWGLYSEWLGIEAGIYETPYENFGRLTYEMWRACRLVVDTGLHALGWTRQQALDFLASNTALSLHEVGTETYRYISWPGQALAYKMGELRIRELRGRAEDALEDRFDVREFHDAVLMNGEIPLSVLETQIENFIADRS